MTIPSDALFSVPDEERLDRVLQRLAQFVAGRLREEVRAEVGARG
ncbi:hypothetical protein [Thermomicrobium sp. CFH 73360]|nr:hypothetical protein [Thermomicrobium sp. CFH 73360]